MPAKVDHLFRPAFYRRKSLWGSLLVSVLLHLLLVYLGRDFRRPESDPEVFRTRLAGIPQFRPQRLPSSAQLEPLRVEMERLAAEPLPLEIPRRYWSVLPPSIPEVELPSLPLALRELVIAAKEDEPEWKRVEMIPPSLLGLADSLGISSMDLLRFVDRARVDKERAVVVIDPGSRRNLSGYINFVRLLLPGAGSRGAALDALARYLNDYTRLLAAVRPTSYEVFLSDNLLKDPIHFLLQGAGLPPYPESPIEFSETERDMLGRYLREGGFLFVEGGNYYLRTVVELLKQTLGGEGRLLELSPSHDIYHSFYEFSGGFPGENKAGMALSPSLDWDWLYPSSTRGAPAATVDMATSAVSQLAAQEATEEPAAQGLWGVEWRGELVAVLSDLRLSAGWARSFVDDPQQLESSLSSLQAGVNVVVYALTRSQGVATKEAPSLWMRQRPETTLPVQRETDEQAAFIDAGLLDGLDASLAIVRSPLGSELGSGGLIVRLNGRYRLESRKKDAHGLLLHNLPPGAHWLELEYGGKRRQLEFELAGGRVSTLTFGLNRFAFIHQLFLDLQDRQVRLDQWREHFADLRLVELHLDDDGRLEGAPDF